MKDLERDLKLKTERPEALDVLEELVISEDTEIRRKAIWCIGKLGQNKANDERILTLLIPFYDDPDPEIREDVAWGIGEASGAGTYDERCCEVICGLLSDEDTMVRGMAAWAAGRLMRKLNVRDDALLNCLRKMRKDDSEYVRNAVDYALGGI